MYSYSRKTKDGWGWKEPSWDHPVQPPSSVHTHPPQVTKDHIQSGFKSISKENRQYFKNKQTKTPTKTIASTCKMFKLLRIFPIQLFVYIVSVIYSMSVKKMTEINLNTLWQTDGENSIFNVFLKFRSSKSCSSEPNNF